MIYMHYFIIVNLTCFFFVVVSLECVW